MIDLIVDETLVRRYGRCVRGVGMHRDAVRSSHTRHSVSAGHKWVVVSIAVRLPCMQRTLALPLASALYTARKQAKRNHAERLYNRHRTVGELTLLLVRLIVRWAPDRRFRLIGDGAYGTHELADSLNPTAKRRSLRRVTLVSRFRMDAALYARPPKYCGHGRPRQKGKRLPAPSAVAASPTTRWHKKEVAWYGGQRKTIRVCSRSGLWYKCGSQAKWVRWVFVRDPQGKGRDEVFFTTDDSLAPEAIVEAFVRRWSLETTFQEMRVQLGLETLRNWTNLAVRRSVPLLFGVYSIVVVWFARSVEHPERYKRETPWYTKRSVTFSDML
ncbi:MAG: transposase, partial [Proteobacteria bacterium]|nr:transposase [Pseudomonadota bacterium]